MLNQFHHQNDWPKLLDSLASSILAFDAPNFWSLFAFHCNLCSASNLLSYKFENISKFSDSSCIIKSCSHCYFACNAFTFSFVSSINCLFSSVEPRSTLLFSNNISKLLIGSSNFHISPYNLPILSNSCSLIIARSNVWDIF